MCISDCLEKLTLEFSGGIKNFTINGFLPLISVVIMMLLMAKGKRRSDSSKIGRNDFSPL